MLFYKSPWISVVGKRSSDICFSSSVDVVQIVSALDDSSFDRVGVCRFVMEIFVDVSWLFKFKTYTQTQWQHIAGNKDIK